MTKKKLTDKQIIETLLNTVKDYADESYWDLRKCACIPRDGGCWIGPLKGPQLARLTLETIKDNTK